MKIKKIKLKNIRSYEECTISIPEGVTLLSGNIGSGKSTILLAVDFALFGIRRGEVDGNALLRNGTDTGYVILDFIVGNDELSIKRILKKSSSGITQSAGYLTINDTTQEFTPVELKQRILEILNYPQEMLTKKSMIYRYTVYTPQEEMKSILIGGKELRLEALRKVFNIDKYKRIKDNHKIISSEIKSRKKELAAFIYDLEEKKEKVKAGEITEIEIKKQIESKTLSIKDLNKNIQEKKSGISSIEEKIKIFNDVKREQEIIILNLKLKLELKSRNTENINQNLIEIEKIKREMGNEPAIITTNSEDITKNLSLKEIELKEIIKKIATLKLMEKQSNELKLKILGIDNCPLCYQSVSQNHKNQICKKEDENLSILIMDLSKYIKLEKENEEAISKLKRTLEELRISENYSKIYELKKLSIKSKEESIKKLNLETEIIKIEIENLELKKSETLLKIIEFKDIELKYKKYKEDLELFLKDQRILEIEKAKKDQDLENLSSLIGEIKKEIEEKEKLKQKLEYFIGLDSWMGGFFINLINIMERKVMLKIYNDFNMLFQEWFKMIMNTESIKVRLDEEFTPIIEQGGYDLDYQNLSGGERSACALSYRLAINQIINNIVSNINTRDILILDEPTEGLSSEQLERIRDVLNQLNMKQILIVSHESRIESFVDNIIKIEKENNCSFIKES